MKYVCVSVFFAISAALILASPQVERYSITAPSGRFEFTKDMAAPPADLSKPPIMLPIATPITEPPQESSSPAPKPKVNLEPSQKL